MLASGSKELIQVHVTKLETLPLTSSQEIIILSNITPGLQHTLSTSPTKYLRVIECVDKTCRPTLKFPAGANKQ